MQNLVYMLRNPFRRLAKSAGQLGIKFDRQKDPGTMKTATMNAPARGQSINAKSPSLDLNPPKTSGIREWIIRGMDGNLTRWEISDKYPVVVEDNALKVSTPKGVDSIPLSKIEVATFRPLVRYAGYADLIIDTVEDGKSKSLYEGTLKGSDPNFLKTMMLLKRNSLLDFRKVT